MSKEAKDKIVEILNQRPQEILSGKPFICLSVVERDEILALLKSDKIKCPFCDETGFTSSELKLHIGHFCKKFSLCLKEPDCPNCGYRIQALNLPRPPCQTCGESGKVYFPPMDINETGEDCWNPCPNCSPKAGLREEFTKWIKEAKSILSEYDNASEELQSNGFARRFSNGIRQACFIIDKQAEQIQTLTEENEKLKKNISNAFKLTRYAVSCRMDNTQEDIEKALEGKS